MPVPDEVEVYFDEQSPPIFCHSLKEVDATLDKLHREADPSADPRAIAIKVFGHEFGIGLGTERVFIHLQIDPCDGEYYLPIGERTEGETQRFYGAGQDSYWEQKNLIPVEAARAAALYFIEHQELDPSVRWQYWDGEEVFRWNV